MVKSIDYIKGLGIFSDYAPLAGLKEFNRYNTFYGCNGSGKSTLATLFRDIELKRQSVPFPKSSWKIKSDTGDIDNDNVSSNGLNIRVFNREFVEANVFTPEGVKGIVYISEESGTDKNNLDGKEAELKRTKEELKKISDILDGAKDDKKSKGLSELNDAFLTAAAKSIKAQFKIIEIQDSRLLNYDKGKLRDFISNYSDAIKAKKSQLSVTEIDKLSKSIKPQDKTAIDTEQYKAFDFKLLNSIHDRVTELCGASITSKSIDRLKQNPQIAQWVYQGLKEIHTPASSVCEFCNQPLPPTRIAELNQHFSDEFAKLQDAITKGIEWLDSNLLEMSFPHSSLLYDEFVPEYVQYVKNYLEAIGVINDTLKTWKAMLEEKQSNPFDAPKAPARQINQEDHQKYDTSYEDVISCIKKHNNKFTNLDAEIKDAKQKLELHYVAEEVTTYDYFAKKEQEENLTKEKNKKGYEIDTINIMIDAIRKSLSNERLGEEQFNNMLHKFLGRNDLCLEHREEGGYIIKRNKTEAASNVSLSEGEKTAIGLVYFIAKLKENGNKIEDTVVVLDDPISSFDSNHLFHANFYVKGECDEAKQLFVFTHNFRFFALLKDWVCKKKAKDATNATNKNIDLFNLYLIKTFQKGDIREGNIENADEVLTHFDSEYHLLFSEVKKFCSSPKLDYISTHTIANISRQLLESFLSFKYGRKKLEKCFDDITGFAEINKVRKFVNDYSHKMDNGDAATGFNDNVFNEADKIVPLVLQLIKHVDSIHYDSMINRLNNT